MRCGGLATGADSNSAIRVSIQESAAGGFAEHATAPAPRTINIGRRAARFIQIPRALRSGNYRIMRLNGTGNRDGRGIGLRLRSGTGAVGRHNPPVVRASLPNPKGPLLV